jgi:hypothetical protein
MKSAPSNKERGPVKLDKSGQPTTNKTANPHRADPNVGQGPRSGNAGTASKQKSFLEEKSDRNSRYQQLADMVTGAFGRRGEGMKPHLEDALEPISSNTNVGKRKSK